MHLADKESLYLAEKIYHIINKKKIDNVEVLDVHELTSLADIFIIATAPNTRQTKAIVDEIEYILEEEHIRVRQKEGYDTATWILMDYGMVIVHVLYKEAAEFYGLDRLWKDSEEIIF